MYDAEVVIHGIANPPGGGTSFRIELVVAKDGFQVSGFIPKKISVQEISQVISFWLIGWCRAHG